jgi:WD40 repeat protein
MCRCPKKVTEWAVVRDRRPPPRYICSRNAFRAKELLHPGNIKGTTSFPTLSKLPRRASSGTSHVPPTSGHPFVFSTALFRNATQTTKPGGGTTGRNKSVRRERGGGAKRAGGRIDKMPPRAVRRPRAASPESESDSGQNFSNATESREGRGASRDSDGGTAPPARKRRLVGETDAVSPRESGDGGLPVGAGAGERGSAALTSRLRSRKYVLETRATCLMFCYELLRESDAGVPLAALPPELVELICRFAVSGSSRLVRFDLHHPERLECVATLSVPDEKYVCALERVSLADGRQVLASGGSRGTIALWDLATRECVGTLVGHSHAVSCLASFPGSDGAALLASGSDDQTIVVWDVVTRTQLATLSGHADCVTALAVFSNASTGYECLASGSQDDTIMSGDGTIVLWDPREYCALATLRGHKSPVRSLCVCRNSSGTDLLASGGDDNLIRFWDLSTHQALFTLAGHENAGWRLSFFTNEDGVPMLVSSCFDLTLRVWDLKSRVSGASVHVSTTPEALVCVAGANGRVLACCTGGFGPSAAVRLYDLSTGESAIEFPLLNAAACIAFVDQASGVPYLAASGMVGNGFNRSGIIMLICARTEETVSP